MEQWVTGGAMGTNFLWCADLQSSEQECLYVDNCHYTGGFRKKIVSAISLMCVERNLLSS